MAKEMQSEEDAPLPELPIQYADYVPGQWNATQQPYPTGECIHQLFEAQVQRTPEMIALVVDEQPMSYRELNCRANQLCPLPVPSGSRARDTGWNLYATILGNASGSPGDSQSGRSLCAARPGVSE